MDAHQEWIEFLHAKEATPIELMPERSALLIVDMQRYFVEPGNSFTDVLEKLVPNVYAGYLERVHNNVIPKIQQLLAAFREAGAPVIYITVGTESGDGTDLPCWLGALDTLGMETIGKPICLPVDVPRWQITDAIAPQKDEVVLNKRSAGTFVTTNLQQELQKNNIEHVVLCGVATDICVSTTTREAADRGYKTVVVSDACTTLSEELHAAHLETLKVFGDVRTTEAVAAAMQQARQAA